MHKNNCAINRDFNNNSCFTLQELHSIANDYNDKYNDKIKLSPSKSEMVSTLTDKLTQFCPDQTCWATLKFLKNNDNNEYNMAFKPKGPGGQFEWLSTTEINECMERFMNIYPHFLFIGAVPMDIEDLDEFGVKSLNYDKLVNIGKTTVAIIYNLDEHYKPGSHWVAFYIDLKKKQIYYSDSAGKPPEKRIKRLVKKIAEKFYFDDTGKKMSLPIESYMNSNNADNSKSNTLNALEQKYDIRYNKIQHQFGGSECGVYSINFITRLLRGDTFDEIHNRRLPDKKINVCRKTYFSGYDNVIKNNDVENIC
jgi:hypothetical protein